MTRPIANNTGHSRLGSQSDTKVKEGDQKKVSDQEINSLENSVRRKRRSRDERQC